QKKSKSYIEQGVPVLHHLEECNESLLGCKFHGNDHITHYREYGRGKNCQVRPQQLFLSISFPYWSPFIHGKSKDGLGGRVLPRSVHGRRCARPQASTALYRRYH